MSEIKFPMPNDQRWANGDVGGTVIASCYHTDEIAAVVILVAEAPFYRTAEVDLNTGKVTITGTYYNITPAVRDSVADAWGGD